MYDHRRLFVRVCAALEREPGASLEAVAAALHVHPHTLAVVIREQAGTSFTAWRTTRRTATACALLRTRPELSIKEVASAAGFSSTSAFDRFLRRTCGRSPSECRAVPDDGARGAGPGCDVVEQTPGCRLQHDGQRIGAAVNARPDPT